MAEILVQPKNLEIDVETLFGGKINALIQKMLAKAEIKLVDVKDDQSDQE